MRNTTAIELGDLRLLREHGYINGKWCAADDNGVIEVTNPANGQVLGKIPNMGPAETGRAIETAHAALATWRRQLAHERADHLMAWHAEMLAHKEDLARLMTLEQGKPIGESRGEIDYAASFIRWFAEEARRLYGCTIPTHLRGRTLFSQHDPVGVVACVTPWNFPSAMITRKAAAAIAAGCPVIVRPASETPYSALALAELADRAGLPEGVFSVVTGESRPICGEFFRDSRVRAMSFTGSTEVGRKLIEQGAQTVKKMSMELGGHAPFLAFDDMDPKKAAEAAVAAKFQTTGQDCLAANRIYVQRGIYDEFLKHFQAATEKLKVGDGFEEGVELGPLMNQGAIDKCRSHVDDATSNGARVLTGGDVHERGGLFFQPTVLADVTPDMKISCEETFGPVAAVSPFTDEDQALELANGTEYGLVAYLFTHDNARILRLSEYLEYGMVAVNGVKITGAPIPFGGFKQSGLGREGGHEGITEFTEVKYVCMAS
jgi:aspartate-semialdehyde dehydrogenase